MIKKIRRKHAAMHEFPDREQHKQFIDAGIVEENEYPCNKKLNLMKESGVVSEFLRAYLHYRQILRMSVELGLNLQIKMILPKLFLSKV